MVAKMILLAVSASAALASASARSLSQQSAFAQAYQLSLSSDAENSTEGDTEADTRGETDTAYADAEGFAGYYYEAETALGIKSGNFAVAETVADTVATNYDNNPSLDAQSLSRSRAISDFAAESKAVSTSESTGGSSNFQFSGTGALSVAKATAAGNEFGSASTVALAAGRRDAYAEADSLAISEEFARATADADAVALNNAAGARSVAVSDTDGGDEDAFAASDATARAVALRGGGATTVAYSGAYNDEDAQADSSSVSISKAFDDLANGRAAGPTTSRATSRAGGAIPTLLP